jgi:hypothetical protein
MQIKTLSFIKYQIMNSIFKEETKTIEEVDQRTEYFILNNLQIK